MRYRVQPIGEDDNPDEEQYEAKPIEVEAENPIQALVNVSHSHGLKYVYNGTDVEWCPDDVVECTEFRFRVYRLDLTDEEKAIVHKINTDPDSPFKGMIR